MTDARGPLYPKLNVDAYDYKGLRIGFCREPWSPENIFLSNTFRPTLKLSIAGAWCDLEIHKLDAHYRYNLRVDGRVYFSRFVLVQSDQCELLTLAQASELKAKKFVPIALSAGLEGLITYLDALLEYKERKEKELLEIESNIGMRLRHAGMTRDT